MSKKLLFQLIEFAVLLLQTHLDGSDLVDTLKHVIVTGMQAYQEEADKPLDQNLVAVLKAL